MKKTLLVALITLLACLALFTACGDNIEYVDFTITAENRNQVGFTGARDENLVIPSKFKDTNGTWYRVVGIDIAAFRGCTFLNSVTIPDSVKEIKTHAFENCTRLSSINIPNSVTSIGFLAFSGCSSLTNINIPASVTRIDFEVFLNCDGLTSIIVNENNTKYHSINNCLIETETKTLIAGCKTSIIPSDGSVTSIGASAFFGCTGLTSVDIPSSATSIGYSSFNECSGLTSITIPNSVTSISNYAFSNCPKLTNITFQGTMAEWNNISFGTNWDTSTDTYTVKCTDGEIPKK